METLIIHSPTLFDDQSNLAYYASSPPLPPAPLGEVPPPFAYGSVHTKFSAYDPQQQINAQFLQTPTPQSSTGDDFTPQFPPQPPASIHPSSRGNNGSTNGLSNNSPTRSEAENNNTSPTSYIPPPLPLRPGRQGALTPIQSLRGTKGLDFSQHEIPEGEWTGPGPTSPPLSDPPTPPPSSYKSSQILSPPSALSQSTFALQQQRQPVLAQILTQEQSQRRPAPLPTIESTAVGDFESTSSSFETHSSSMVDDGHSADTTPITPDGPTRSPLQPVASQTSTQQDPQMLAQLQTQTQVPIKTVQVQEQSQPSPVRPLRPPDKTTHGGPELRDPPPSQLQ